MTETEVGLPTYPENHFQPTDDGAPSPLRTLCQELNKKVLDFLESKPEEEILRNVQGQCWRTMTIISDALEKYP